MNMNVFEENKDLFDLGSTNTAEEFNPFAIEEEADENNVAESESAPKQDETKSAPNEQTKSSKAEQSLEGKLPVFTYGGATEEISDTSKTFDELRIEKSVDFPELEEGKRVSWTVEYGKITKNVPDPKGTSACGTVRFGVWNGNTIYSRFHRNRGKVNEIDKTEVFILQSRISVNPYRCGR